MERKFLDSGYKKVHFIGVGGVSTSGLAEYLLCKNFIVSGSDLVKNSQTERLKKLGAEIFYGHEKQNTLGADAVVFTSAIDDNNPELLAAQEKGVPVYARAELLGEISGKIKNSVAVSGSHGKTTTSAIIAKALILAGKNPTVFLGGESEEVKNFLGGGDDYGVVEACEYKKNMLYIKPKIAVVLNIDDDHLDSYGDMSGVINAFKKFTDGRITVVNADDKNSTAIFNPLTVTFGIENFATYTARNIKFENGFYSFTVYAFNRRLERIKLPLKGRHNVYNALAAFAVLDILGVNAKVVKTALESFKGVKRRCEYLGEYNGTECFADYAHHPSEILATLESFKESGKNPLVVFQPHTYSRTKLLKEDFVNALLPLKYLLIYKTYAAREEFDRSGDAKTLSEEINGRGGNAIYTENYRGLSREIGKRTAGCDSVLFLGAGDIYDLAVKFSKGDKNKK